MRIALLLLLLVTLPFGAVRAQDSLSRPKIGLVLAGGGAKGLAHIGVIRVLEEAGFDVDMVGGTSMGSIIGGLYALGYTAEEMKDQVAGIDWGRELSQEADPETQPLPEREARARYQLSLPVRGWTLGLPSGFNNGQKVYLQLSWLTEKFHNVLDFRELPRDFFCIACDFYTGEEVLLDHGFLPDAMRASSSIPSFFSPVSLEECVLIDGGWVNNFPVERMKQRGADFIIGVDFPRQLPEEGIDLSLVDVLVESGSYVNTRINAANRALCDVLIVPELGSLNAADYTSADTIVRLGEIAARKMIDRLRFLADSLGIRPRAIPDPLPRTDISITQVSVEGLGITERRVMDRLLKADYSSWSHPEDRRMLVRDLYGSGDYDRVSYRLDADSAGNHLQLNLVKKATPASLNFSLNYTTDYKVALLVNYTRRNWLCHGNRLLAGLVISENPVFRLRTHSVLGPGWRPAAEAEAFRFGQPFYVSGKSFSRYSLEQVAVSAGFQKLPAVYTSLAVMATFRHAVYSGDAYDLLGLRPDRQSLIDLKVAVRYLPWRDPRHPRGTTAVCELVASSPTDRSLLAGPTLFYRARLSQALSAGQWSFTATLHSGSTLNRRLTGPNRFFAGSYGPEYPLNLQPAFGYDRMELIADGGIHTAHLEVSWSPGGNHAFLAVGGAGVTADRDKGEFLSFHLKDFGGFGGGYVYHSPVGPLRVLMARPWERADWKLNLLLGYWF